MSLISATSLLIALYPALFLYSRNLDDIGLYDFTLLLAVQLIVWSAAVLLTRAFVRDARKRSIIVAGLLTLFFCYAHLSAFITQIATLRGKATGVADILMGFIFAAAAIWIVRMVMRGSALRDEILATFLNAFALILFCMALFPIGREHLLDNHSMAVRSSPDLEPLTKAIQAADQKPDIFYIVLDGYGRADLLKELYSFSNEEFLSFLSKQGFFVAEQALANYPQTLLSLSASLNMQYVPDLLQPFDPGYSRSKPLHDLIHHSLLFGAFQQSGYELVSFETGKKGTELESADQYLGSNRTGVFAQQLLTTFSVPGLKQILSRVASEAHRERIGRILEYLGSDPKARSPRFVFAHILAPHPPFIFGQKGERREEPDYFTFGDGDHFGDRTDYAKLYVDQLMYLNSRLTEIVPKLLSRTPQPIVILQGDHGPGLQYHMTSLDKANISERFSPLIAVFLPGQNYQEFSEAISPVNLFRRVLDTAFKTKLEKLEDHAYWASYFEPYRFTEVTAQARRAVPSTSYKELRPVD